MIAGELFCTVAKAAPCRFADFWAAFVTVSNSDLLPGENPI